MHGDQTRSPCIFLDNKGVIIEEMQDENNEAVSDTTQAEPDVNEKGSFFLIYRVHYRTQMFSKIS